MLSNGMEGSRIQSLQWPASCPFHTWPTRHTTPAPSEGRMWGCRVAYEVWQAGPCCNAIQSPFGGSIRTRQSICAKEEQKVCHVDTRNAVQIERTIRSATKLAEEQEDVIYVHKAITIDVLRALALFKVRDHHHCNRCLRHLASPERPGKRHYENHRNRLRFRHIR